MSSSFFDKVFRHGFRKILRYELTAEDGNHLSVIPDVELELGQPVNIGFPCTGQVLAGQNPIPGSKQMGLHVGHMNWVSQFAEL